ncbi:DUF3048 domain-containing protein [Nakamurella endophytica]|uniref:DUF3048 domain-containing protein n=1 Tax=Nakamurella endophytica TaxID=1748367 RepID=UPI00166B2046|nr:DUF3048 domain-containing protein [Nakamurella endophytica]
MTDPLTGGAVSTNPVVAVKIDNTFFQVPQFGVADADMVFVEQVEGGLTRLMAVFHTVLPAEVGPVRSVRSTDAELLPAFGRPALVFAGGADGPMSDLGRTSIVDTSARDDAYFRSDAAWGTYNLHADLQRIARLPGLGAARSIGTVFDDRDPRLAAGRPVHELGVTMEAGRTDFVYQAQRWTRTRQGSPVTDWSGALQAPDNVLVLHVTDEPDGTVDTLGAPSFLSHTVGSGAATLYRNGRALDGRWARPAAGASFRLVADVDGQPLRFKPGRTWIVLAPQSARVDES